MSDDRLGRVHLDSKGLSSFKITTASLGCDFVFPIWQLIYVYETGGTYSAVNTQSLEDAVFSRDFPFSSKKVRPLAFFAIFEEGRRSDFL